MSESKQHVLDRVRKPRVHITYDVEIGDAIETRELPFVVGVLADLSGMPEVPLPKLKERKFVEMDRDNFEEILAVIKPRLVIRIRNTLSDEIPEISVELRFSKMEDFEPQSIASNTPQLKSLYDRRNSLKNLMSKMDGNDSLELTLSEIMKNKDLLKRLKEEIQNASSEKSEGVDDASAPPGSTESE
jgi:type VI secretion system protein ImpB